MQAAATFSNGHSWRSWATFVLRICVLSAMILAAFALVIGSVAHAMEPAKSLTVTEAIELGHVSGDRDQSPSDGEKSFAHHHGGCHGHQFGEPATAQTNQFNILSCTFSVFDVANMLKSTTTDPGLRPPMA